MNVGSFNVPQASISGSMISGNRGDCTLPNVSIASAMDKTDWGVLETPQVSISGSMHCIFTYTGNILNRYGVPIAGVVCAISVVDNSLKDSQTVTDGSYTLTANEPCFIIALPDNSDKHALGWITSYG